MIPAPPGAEAAGATSDSEVTIYIGGVHASETGAVVKTLLGSCVSVCLWDPVRAIGGMNHFMLPHGADGEGVASRFGVHAMDCLVGALMKLGGDPRRFIAKMFGGAHVLDVGETETAVPRQNIAFARDYLQTEKLRLVNEDVGGYQPRQVRFHTDTGRALVRRLPSGRIPSPLVARERAAREAAPGYGDVTLWD